MVSTADRAQSYEPTFWLPYRQCFSENSVDPPNRGFELFWCDPSGQTRRKLRIESIAETKYRHVAGACEEKFVFSFTKWNGSRQPRITRDGLMVVQ